MRPLVPTRAVVVVAAIVLAWATLCSAARAITVQVVNDGRVPSAQIKAFEQAAVAQALQLRDWWQTPAITFGTDGWRLELFKASDPRLASAPGWHGYLRQPYAVVAHTRNWTRIASHELLEMLADPYASQLLDGYLAEVCDPVKTLSYRVRGVLMADFVTPAWFTGAAGPYDLLRRVASAHSVEFGFAYAQVPGGGTVIVGNGPF